MTSPAQNDFNYAILDATAHRPWPMPSSAWVMTQTWHDLLFAHWPVDGTALRARIPAGFDLDEFAGQAWVGVVPFQMTNVAPLDPVREPADLFVGDRRGVLRTLSANE